MMKTSVILAFLLCWSFVSSKPNQTKSNDKSVGELNYKNDRGSDNSNLTNGESSDDASSGKDWGGVTFNLLNHKDFDSVDKSNHTDNKLKPLVLISEGLKTTKEFLQNLFEGIVETVKTLIPKSKNNKDSPSDDANNDNILSWIKKNIDAIFRNQDHDREIKKSVDEEAEKRGDRVKRDLGTSGLENSPYGGSISEHLLKLSEGSASNVLRSEKATVAEALNGRAAIRKILARAKAREAKAARHRSLYNSDDFSKWLLSGSSFDTSIFKHPLQRPSDSAKSQKQPEAVENSKDSRRHSFPIARHASESTKQPHREAKRTFDTLSDATTTVDVADNKHSFTSLLQKSKYRERPSSKAQVTSGEKNEMFREPALSRRNLLPSKDRRNGVPKWIQRNRSRPRKPYYVQPFEFMSEEEKEKYDKEFIFKRTFNGFEDEKTKDEGYENSLEMNAAEGINHDRVLDDEETVDSRGGNKPGRKRYYYKAGNREPSVHDEADAITFDEAKNRRLTGFLVEHTPPIDPHQEENIRKRAKQHNEVQRSAIYPASSTETTEGVEREQSGNMLIKKISTGTPTWKVADNDIELYHSRDQNTAANAATSFSSSLSDAKGNKHTNNAPASPSVDDGSAAAERRAGNNDGVPERPQPVIDNDATEIEMGLGGIKSHRRDDLSSTHSSRSRARSEIHLTSREGHRGIGEYQHATVDAASSTKTKHSINSSKENSEHLEREKAQENSAREGRENYEGYELNGNQEMTVDVASSEKATASVKNAREHDLSRAFSSDEKNFVQGVKHRVDLNGNYRTASRHKTSIEVIDINDRSGKAYVSAPEFPIRKFRKGHAWRDVDYYNFEDGEMYGDRFIEADEFTGDSRTNETDYNDLEEENEDKRDEYNQHSLSRQAFNEYIRNLRLTTTMSKTEFEQWIVYLYFIWQQEIEKSNASFEISTSATGKSKKQAGTANEEISSLRRLAEKHTADKDNRIHLRKHEEQPSRVKKLITKNAPGSVQSTHSIEIHEITATKGHEIEGTKSEVGASSQSENHKTVETRAEMLNRDSSTADTVSGGVNSGRKTINNNSHQQGSQNSVSENSRANAQTESERAHDAHRRTEDVDTNKYAETMQSAYAESKLQPVSTEVSSTSRLHGKLPTDSVDFSESSVSNDTNNIAAKEQTSSETVFSDGAMTDYQEDNANVKMRMVSSNETITKSQSNVQKAINSSKLSVESQSESGRDLKNMRIDEKSNANAKISADTTAVKKEQKNTMTAFSNNIQERPMYSFNSSRESDVKANALIHNNRQINDTVSRASAGLTFTNAAENEYRSHLRKSLSSFSASETASSEKSQAEFWHNRNNSQNSETNVADADPSTKITSLINAESERRSDASNSLSSLKSVKGTYIGSTLDSNNVSEIQENNIEHRFELKGELPEEHRISKLKNKYHLNVEEVNEIGDVNTKVSLQARNEKYSNNLKMSQEQNIDVTSASFDIIKNNYQREQNSSSSSSSSADSRDKIEDKKTGTSTPIIISNNNMQNSPLISSSTDSMGKSEIDGEYLNKRKSLKEEKRTLINDSAILEISTTSRTTSNKNEYNNRNELLETLSLSESHSVSKEKEGHVAETIENIWKPVTTIKASTESTISSSDAVLQNNLLKTSTLSDTSKNAQANWNHFNMSTEKSRGIMNETTMEIKFNHLYEENRRKGISLNASYEQKQTDSQLDGRNETSVNNSVVTLETTTVLNKQEALEHRPLHDTHSQKIVESVINSEVKLKNSKDVSSANEVTSMGSATSTSFNGENKTNLPEGTSNSLHVNLLQKGKRRSDIRYDVNEIVSNENASYDDEKARNDILKKVIFSSNPRNEEASVKYKNILDIPRKSTTIRENEKSKEDNLRKTILFDELRMKTENTENVPKRYVKESTDDHLEEKYQNNLVAESAINMQNEGQDELISSTRSNATSKNDLKSSVSTETKVVNKQTRDNISDSRTTLGKVSSSTLSSHTEDSQIIKGKKISAEAIDSGVNKNALKSDLTQEESLFVPSEKVQIDKEHNDVGQKANIEDTARTRTSEDITNLNVSAIECQDDVRQETSVTSQLKQRNLNVQTGGNAVISNVLLSIEGTSPSETRNTQQDLSETITSSSADAKIVHENISNLEIIESQQKLTGDSPNSRITKSQAESNVESNVLQDRQIVAEASADTSELSDNFQNARQYKSLKKNSLTDPAHDAHPENEEKNVPQNNAAAVVNTIASAKEGNVIKGEQQNDVTKTTSLFSSRAEAREQSGYNSAVERISTDMTSFSNAKDRLSENKNSLKRASSVEVESGRQGDSQETTSSVNSFANAPLKGERESSVREEHHLVTAHSTELSNSKALDRTDSILKSDPKKLTAISPSEPHDFVVQDGMISQEGAIEAKTSSNGISEALVENTLGAKIQQNSRDNSTTVVDSATKTESSDRREDLHETASTRDILHDVDGESTSSANSSYIETQAASEDTAKSEKVKEDRGINILTLGNTQAYNQVKGTHPSGWLVTTSDAGALAEERARNKDKFNVLKEVEEIAVYAETSAGAAAADNIEGGQRDTRVENPGERRDASNVAAKIQDAAATSGVSVEMTSSSEARDESESASISSNMVTATSSHEESAKARIKNEEESSVSSSSESSVNVGRKAEAQSSTIHLPSVETAPSHSSRETGKCDDDDHTREFIREATGLYQMLSKQQDSEMLLMKKNLKGPVQVASLKNGVPPLIAYRLIPREVYEKVRTIIATRQILCAHCPLFDT